MFFIAKKSLRFNEIETIAFSFSQSVKMRDKRAPANQAQYEHISACAAQLRVSFLAMRTIAAAASPDNRTRENRTAQFASFAFASVYPQQRGVAVLPAFARKILFGRSRVALYSPSHDMLYLPRKTPPIGGAQIATSFRGIDSRGVKDFVGIDISDAGHDSLVEQHFLDRPCPPSLPRFKKGGGKIFVKRLQAQLMLSADIVGLAFFQQPETAERRTSIYLAEVPFDRLNVNGMLFRGEIPRRNQSPRHS